jgi:hypothetical protein
MKNGPDCDYKFVPKYNRKKGGKIDTHNMLCAGTSVKISGG